MKTIYRICFVCCLAIICFCAGMFMLVFVMKANDYVFISQRELTDIRNSSLQTKDVSVMPQTADLSTTYYVEQLNSVTGEEELIQEEIPHSLVGANREEIEQFITEYNKAPALSDKEKGFVDAQLEEFSSDKIVVRKVYKPLEKDVFFLKSEENFIVVYYSDLSTVYMYTDIVMDQLPEEIQAEINEGKQINSLENLYSFLESYTS